MPLFPFMLLRRAVRVLGWNALVLLGGLSLLVLGGEVYFRLTKPFMIPPRPPFHWVPTVGYMRKPHTEVRYTNRLDYWTVSRTNRLGFIDREPPSPAQAAASCHLAMLGDSFVEAKEVSIADKFHVRLEALAARELPQLHVTTSAFGRDDAGQVWQLAFYDAYVRSLHPKLVVLVFMPNDFEDNSLMLRTLYRDLDHPSEPSVARRPDGTLELRLPPSLPFSPPPVPLRALPPPPPPPWIIRALEKASRESWFAGWLAKKMRPYAPRNRWSFSPLQALFQGDWRPTSDEGGVFAHDDLLPVYAEALEYTAFALEQFKARTARDGGRLLILASHRMKIQASGLGVFERLQDMTATLGIPVIDQAAYIVRQGATPRDAQWRHDPHWNVAGHRWAAEALLEWLRQHPEVCDGTPANSAP